MTKEFKMPPDSTIRESAANYDLKVFGGLDAYDAWLESHDAKIRADVEQDERIAAWDRIARHPFFNAAFDDSPRPLIDSMIELLDKAVSLPSKGENVSDLDFKSQPDMDGDTLDVVAFAYDEVKYKGSVQFGVYSEVGGSAVLTLKDVAALHKALGDHLEAHKRELPRGGAVRFSGGQIAQRLYDYDEWYVTGNPNPFTSDALEHGFGTDWEELVVKDA